MRLIKNKNLVCEPFYKSQNVKEINSLTDMEAIINRFSAADTKEECEQILSDLKNKGSFGKYPKEQEWILQTLCTQKIEKLELKETINNLYSEVQCYQSKYINQYSVSAIGEMTTGIAEEILNPLQIILSYADILDSEGENGAAVSRRIKGQVNKVEEMVKRLLRFASYNHEKIAAASINIPSVINSIYGLVKSTLQINKIETVLDLDKKLPSVVSSEVYLNQLFTNLFSIIIKSELQDEGLLIQARQEGRKIVVRFVLTAELDNKKCEADLKILNNMLVKNNWKMFVNFTEHQGTIIEIYFPVLTEDRK